MWHTWIVLALSACAGGGDSGKGGDSGGDSGSADTGPAAVTEHYAGTSVGRTPDGSYEEPPEDLLFIRALDPAAATITERVWSEARPEWAYSELVHRVDAAAGTFTAEFVTADGTMDVAGGYDAGEPWAWTAWHSASTYRDGAYAGWVVSSVDVMDGAGVVTADKVITDADGAEVWAIQEVLTPVSEEAFAAAQEAAGIGG